MSNGRSKNANMQNIADTRTKKTGKVSLEENVFTSSEVKTACTRPRDVRSSNKKECYNFSRASAARRSLGCTNQAWPDVVDELETTNGTSRPLSCVYNSESNLQQTSFSTSNENHKATLKRPRDLKYDRDIFKLARILPIHGPLDLDTYGFKLRPVFDESAKRWWAAQIKRSNGPKSANSSSLALREDDLIVQVNGREVRNKSSESLVSSITHALQTSETVVLSVLRPSEILSALPAEDFSNVTEGNDEDSNSQAQHSSVSPMTPITCIKNLYAFNTRSIGQRLAVELVKSAEGGFGISFATRDTMVSPTMDEPIFIDRIMPTGSAVQDGRLQFGDRLLAINNVEVTSFESAVSQLRDVPVGKKATLLVSRQNEVLSTGLMGRASPGFTMDDPPVCRTYTFKIPVPPPEAANTSIGIRFAFSEQPLILHSPTEAGLPLCEPGAMIGEVFPSDDQEVEADATAEAQDLSGIYVQMIKPNSPADNGDASVRVGDRLVAVNGQNVMGRSLSEVADLLTSTIAACRARTHKHRPTIKFTVNRFFQRKTQSERLASENSRDVRHEVTPQSERTKGHRDSSVPSNVKTPRKKTSVTIYEREGERPSRRDSSSSRHNRSASVDPRGRSRKETLDDSALSPKRRSSTFTREAMGRRSVSEKRHANMEATSIKFFNENVLPLRYTDENTSRLYSTMPSVRGVRQLRRAKQGRSSGPVKPVHGKDVFSTPPLMPRSLASSPDVLRTDMSNSKGSDVSPVRSSESNFVRSRSYNQSFRNALDTTFVKPEAPLPPEISTFCAPGPPVLPSRFRPQLPSAGGGDANSSSSSSSPLSAISSSALAPQNNIECVATLPRKSGRHHTPSAQSTSPPPVPARRTKPPAATAQQSPSTEIPPDYQMSLDRHLLSRGLNRVNSTTQRDLTSPAMQHQKIIQDFMKHHRSGKRDKYNLASKQAASSSSPTTASPSSRPVRLKKVTNNPARPTSPIPSPQSFSPKVSHSSSSTTRIPTSPVPLPSHLFNAYMSPVSEASPELPNQTHEAPRSIPSSAMSQRRCASPVYQISTSPAAAKCDFLSSVAQPKSPKVFSSSSKRQQRQSAFLEEVETSLRRKHTAPNGGGCTVTSLQASPLSSSSSSSSSQKRMQSCKGRVEHHHDHRRQQLQQPADPYCEQPSADEHNRRRFHSHLIHPTEEYGLQSEEFPKLTSVPYDLENYIGQATNDRLPMPPPNSLTNIPRRPSSARYLHSPHTVVRSKSPAVERHAGSQHSHPSRGSFDDAAVLRSPRRPNLSAVARSPAADRQLSSPAPRYEADYFGYCRRQSPAPPRYSREDYIFKEKTPSRPHVPKPLPAARNSFYVAQPRSSRTRENGPKYPKQSSSLTVCGQAHPNQPSFPATSRRTSLLNVRQGGGASLRL